MQIRSVLVLAAVILGLGTAQGSAWAAPQVAGGAASPALTAVIAPTESCTFGIARSQVLCLQDCHSGMNDAMCTDIVMMMRSCIKSKCAKLKLPPADPRLDACEAAAVGQCARIMGCTSENDSGREAQ